MHNFVRTVIGRVSSRLWTRQ
jgi:alkyl hydroperoxide reductase subunit AhpC